MPAVTWGNGADLHRACEHLFEGLGAMSALVGLCRRTWERGQYKHHKPLIYALVGNGARGAARVGKSRDLGQWSRKSLKCGYETSRREGL